AAPSRRERARGLGLPLHARSGELDRHHDADEGEENERRDNRDQSHEQPPSRLGSPDILPLDGGRNAIHGGDLPFAHHRDQRAIVQTMAPHSIGSGTISFGLVSIPIRLYTAASSANVAFNML